VAVLQGFGLVSVPVAVVEWVACDSTPETLVASQACMPDPVIPWAPTVVGWLWMLAVCQAPDQGRPQPAAIAEIASAVSKPQTLLASLPRRLKAGGMTLRELTPSVDDQEKIEVVVVQTKTAVASVTGLLAFPTSPAVVSVAHSWY
jgi:hypothetical protein